jgi:hypothetical protein
MLKARENLSVKYLKKDIIMGQFKFLLCSLAKFFIGDKPGTEKKKSIRGDWLRNQKISL